ncbi:MAG: aldo/keto reductase [Lachnospiraceae bacterium]
MERIGNDGLILPPIGFGTYTLKGEAGVTSLINAIHAGYRLIDSAFNYENEGTVGRAVKECGASREELLIASKLPGRHHAYDAALQTVQESLYRAGLDYFDIYMIHWPNPITDRYVEAWQAMIEAKKRGYVRSIGVCNFLPVHLKRLQQETSVLPSLNQIELHPFFQQKQARDWNTKNGIVTQSWSPLGRGTEIFKNEILNQIAKHYGKSESQIVLRWHIQIGAIPIPKAGSLAHQLDNLNIFDFSLTQDEMKKIEGLTRDDGRLKNQDPAIYEEF